jgi:toxin ParE1/3/4
MTFVLSPRAALDLEEVGDYIALGNPERAITFTDELLLRCARAGERPTAYPRREDFGAGIRMAVHGRYRILFRMVRDGVRVERILHTARRVPRRV